MDGTNFLTSGDLALIENHRGYNHYGYNYGGCAYPYHQKNGMAATGVALGAGLGGAALIGVFLAAWGVNQASKARAKAAEQQAALLDSNLNRMSNLLIAENQGREAAIREERTIRENWQNYHAPSTTQYVDVRTGAGAFAGAGANAWSQAEATILSNALSGRTQMSPQEVTLVAKQNCGCPATNCGCNG